MKKTINRMLNAKTFLVILGIALMLPCQQIAAQGGKKKPAGKSNVSSPKKVEKPSAASNTPKRDNNISKPSDKRDNIGDQSGRKNNVSNSGNKTNNIGSNNNKVNVDNSRKNVNVNVDNSKNVRVNNSRNTSVRHNSRPYGRPPHVYGGRRYRCYRPYAFHPYRPFIWGPRWHPWGFFVTTLAVTAIILSVDTDMPVDFDMAQAPVLDNSYYSFEEQPALPGASFASYTENPKYSNGQAAKVVSIMKDEYYYDEGVYYIKADGGYTVVSAPIGATIKTLPTGYETVSADDKTKNYYYGGTFYEKTAAGYTVVAPTAGTVVSNVSEGGEEVKMGDVTYVKLGETYYQPIKEDGKDMYEVADVEEDK